MTEKNTIGLRYRIGLAELRFLYKLPWGMGERAVLELFKQWDRWLGKGEGNLTFFGEWSGKPAYVSAWLDREAGLSQLSTTWIEQVLTAEVVEKLKCLR